MLGWVVCNKTPILLNPTLCCPGWLCKVSLERRDLWGLKEGLNCASLWGWEVAIRLDIGNGYWPGSKMLTIIVVIQILFVTLWAYFEINLWETSWSTKITIGWLVYILTTTFSFPGNSSSCFFLKKHGEAAGSGCKVARLLCVCVWGWSWSWSKQGLLTLQEDKIIYFSNKYVLLEK